MHDATKSDVAFEWSQSAKLYVELLKDCLTASIYDESAWAIVEPRPLRSKNEIKWTPLLPLRRFLIGLLRNQRLLLVRPRAYDATKRASGSDWPLFGYTMTGRARMDNLEQCIRDVIERQVAGDFIETGVWRGGSVMFMRAMLKLYGITDRVVWVADSFEGMPIPREESDGWDRSHVEQLRVSLQQVRQNFARFGLLDDQVQFLKGWFSDTLPKAPIQRLAIVRLDGDPLDIRFFGKSLRQT
jgi:hypothetical protein